MKFILLADCRCGGNALRSALASHPELRVEDELFNPRREDYRAVENVGRWIASTFGRCDGFHLQRYQIPNEEAPWRQLIVPGLRVIDLRRDDTLAQYRSWKLAMASDQWRERPQAPPRVVWDPIEAESIQAGWRDGRRFTDRVFRRVPSIHVEYESLNDDFQVVVRRCLRFLGVRVTSLQPGFPKPHPVDYQVVFDRSTMS